MVALQVGNCAHLALDVSAIECYSIFFKQFHSCPTVFHRKAWTWARFFTDPFSQKFDGHSKSYEHATCFKQEVMMKNTENWMIFFLAVVMLAGVISILGTLPSSITPKATLLIEIAKILTSALVGGILVGYAKIVLERLQVNRQEAAARISAKNALFEALQRSTRKALRSLRDDKANAASFATWLSHDDGDFEDLLARWETIDPKMAHEVHHSYLALEERFAIEGPTQGFRHSAINSVISWTKCFQNQAIGDAWGKSYPISSNIKIKKREAEINP